MSLQLLTADKYLSICSWPQAANVVRYAFFPGLLQIHPSLQLPDSNIRPQSSDPPLLHMSLATSTSTLGSPPALRHSGKDHSFVSQSNKYYAVQAVERIPLYDTIASMRYAALYRLVPENPRMAASGRGIQRLRCTCGGAPRSIRPRF